MMKKLLMSMSDGMVERNLLKTDFLDYLLHIPDLEISFLVSEPEIFAYLQKEYQKFPIRMHFVPFGITKLDALFALVFQNSIHTTTLKENQYNGWQGLNERKKLSTPTYLFYRLFWHLGKYRFWRSFLRFLYSLIRSDYAQKVLKEIQPDLVFVTSISPADYKLAAQSKKLGYKTVQMIKSWDNLTTKTSLYRQPDYLIVHNEVMAKEAVTLDDLPKKRIFVSGIPQFDYLVKNRNKLEIPREKFYQSIGIDPKKNVILFTASGDWLSPNDQDFILMLNEAIEKEKLVKDCHVQVRLHPKYLNKLDRVQNLSHITIHRPFSYLDKEAKNWVFGEQDMTAWYNSIRHSAMVLNVASTMSIDAAVLGRPAICLAFDGYDQKPWHCSIARYYVRDHYANVMKTGGVQLAKSEEEMIKQINNYLEDDKRDQAGRERLVRQQCYKLDGESSERIARFLETQITTP